MYIKTPFELQPEDDFTQKPKHVPNMIFYYLLIIFCIIEVMLEWKRTYTHVLSKLV